MFPGLIDALCGDARDTSDGLLRANSHPEDWINPQPEPLYDLVVMGGGPAGLVAAMGASTLGARVALVERHLLGGDCLNAGCVPSKALLRAGRARADLATCDELGLEPPPAPLVPFDQVMARLRRVRAGISFHDSAHRLHDMGIGVFLGMGWFGGRNIIQVGGATLRFRRACIATGARPHLPAVPGLREASPLTNETIFQLNSLPGHLVVIGGGPVGCELAQAFARLGSRVTLLEVLPQVLSREDPGAARVVEASLIGDGVEIICGARLLSVRADGRDRRVFFDRGRGQGPQCLEADQILVAAGRLPNVDGLNLEAAGVEADREQGIRVDDHLRTTNRAVYAAGDVCSRAHFTHAADAMARIVVRNALFRGRARASALTIPHCIFTDPELAQVGLTPAAAAERGVPLETHTVGLQQVDRAVIDGDEAGFLKVHLRAGTDRIVGATAVSRHAADLIGTLTLAMAHGLGLRKLGQVVFPYPAHGQAIKLAADACQRKRLTPLARAFLSALKVGAR